MRRRLMLESQDKAVRFVPGVYLSSNGNHYNTVNQDGSISSDTSVLFFVEIPLTGKISYKSGDVLKFTSSREYQSMKYFRTITLLGSADLRIASNEIFNKYAATSVTASQDGWFDAVNFENSSNDQTGTVKPLIYINDVLVIGG